jgi:hypothetical protein
MRLACAAEVDGEDDSACSLTRPRLATTDGVAGGSGGSARFIGPMLLMPLTAPASPPLGCDPVNDG